MRGNVGYKELPSGASVSLKALPQKEFAHTARNESDNGALICRPAAIPPPLVLGR
jgi:hypothetical protein